MQKFNAQYFKHDFNASQNTKIQKLLFKQGHKGYGVYWCFIEHLHNNQGQVDNDYEQLAFALRIDNMDLLKSVINDFDLFDVQEDYISNHRVKDNLKQIMAKSEKAKSSAKIRWEKENKKKALKKSTDKPLEVVKDKNIEDYIDMLQKDEGFNDALYNKYKIRKGTLPAILIKFNEHLRVYPSEYKNLSDFKNHFANWIGSQLDKGKLRSYYRGFQKGDL